MPLVQMTAADGSQAPQDRALADGRTQVDSLMKVVACYRVLSSLVGGSTDSLQVRDELRQTRQKALNAVEDIRVLLTSHLRNKNLPMESRREAENLWVLFSSSLELLHADMRTVFTIGETFCLENNRTLVKTGIQGGGSAVAARALSLLDLTQMQTSVPAGLEVQERSSMEKEILQVDHMLEDMETKVNVLRWTVEPREPKNPETLSCADSTSLSLLSVHQEPQQHCRGHLSPACALLLLVLLVLLTATLSSSIILFS